MQSLNIRDCEKEENHGKRRIVKNCQEGYGEHYLVDKNTICRYTGLPDINGNKIWEYDILKDVDGDYCIIRNGLDKESPIASFICCYSDINSDNCMMLEKKNIKELKYEVVGNIFDNLEILTQ